jgi:hypothetical protein
MTRKKIQFKPKSELKSVDQALDEWVNTPIEDNRIQPQQNSNSTGKKFSENPEDSFRFTFHMPTTLHKKIKKYCVDNEISMKDKIVEILEREFSHP